MTIKLTQLYHVRDFIPLEQRKALGLSGTLGATHRDVGAQWTGEKRPPRQGEWYLSGAIIKAYLAPNDLSSVFHIARLVRTETVTRVIDGNPPAETKP